jgi:hypothetical protein
MDSKDAWSSDFTLEPLEADPEDERGEKAWAAVHPDPSEEAASPRLRLMEARVLDEKLAGSNNLEELGNIVSDTVDLLVKQVRNYTTQCQCVRCVLLMANFLFIYPEC